MWPRPAFGSAKRRWPRSVESESVIEPSIKSNRFTCPHCNEEADQVWLNVYAHPVSNPEGLPLRIEGEGLRQLSENPQFPPDVCAQKVAYWNRVNGGEVFLDRWVPVQTDLFVAGMELSVCRACTRLSVWLGGERVQG
ncbi:MAG: hypothetical protein ACE5G3_09580 [Gammaproteobacteria bacterium]